MIAMEISTTLVEGPIMKTGVVWNVTDAIEFYPHIHTKATRPLNADSFALGAYLEWVAL